MPPSALDQLTRLNIEYPLLFKITNKKHDRQTHAGVLEFIADEGKIYIPFWMMRNLLLEEGDLVTIDNVSLPVATFSRFQPQSVDFLDITNPKAVLENCLRNFACLTTGDLVAINYNNKIFELCVLETKPGRAVTIIECDMNVSVNISQFQLIADVFLFLSFRWSSMPQLATKSPSECRACKKRWRSIPLSSSTTTTLSTHSRARAPDSTARRLKTRPSSNLRPTS